MNNTHSYFFISVLFLTSTSCSLVSDRILMSKNFWKKADIEKLHVVLKFSRKDLNVLIDDKGRTLPYYAAIYGNCIECISLLAEKGVDFNKKNNGFPLFHTMLSRVSFNPATFTFSERKEDPFNIRMFKAVLKTGADINQLDELHKIPSLFPAIYFHRGVNFIKFMIEMGADLHFQRTENGRTTLILALKTYNGKIDMEVIKILLQYGADPTVKDTENKTALDHMALDEKFKKTALFKKLQEKYQRF